MENFPPRTYPSRGPFQEHGRQFIRYHVDGKTPNSADLFDEKNRRAARSFWSDLSEIFIKPLFREIMFHLVYFLALWDDIQFTWNWGKYKGHDKDYCDNSANNSLYYTRSWDRPTREQFEWSQRPAWFVDMYE